MEPLTTKMAVLDQDYLQENYHKAGFSYLLPEILGLCRQQAAASLNVIQQRFSAGDIQGVISEAHLLKGTAGTSGASLLAEEARLIEDHGTSADPEALLSMLNDLKTAVSLTDSAISAELDRLSADNLNLF